MIPKGKRKCKICGKEYEYCKTKAHGAFRWQNVACCPEHAAQYFEEIAISRGEKEPPKTEQTKKQFKEQAVKKDPVEKKGQTLQDAQVSE